MTEKPRTNYSPQGAACLLGLLDPTTIIDPKRLERLARTARFLNAHAVAECPPRYRIAADDYVALADWCLETPERLEG